MSFYTIQWRHDGIEILDQRLLPEEVKYIILSTPDELVDAIKTLAVRGAPAIGIAAAMGAALGAKRIGSRTTNEFLAEFDRLCAFIAQARPTAKNLFWALDRMKAKARSSDRDVDSIIAALEDEAQRILKEDIEINHRIGSNGQTLIDDKDTILTHCNAGALATGGYGTALGVIRSAVENKKHVRVIAAETRPLMQGSRLTAWELLADGIDTTLITDTMTGYCFSKGLISKVITGADRIAANGDTANKIGTYTLSVLAKEHGVPFFIAAPISTIDPETKTGGEIPIEERSGDEVRHFMGVQSAPQGIRVMNPAFDVTPAQNITAIITERGIVFPPYTEGIRRIFLNNGE